MTTVTSKPVSNASHIVAVRWIKRLQAEKQALQAEIAALRAENIRLKLKQIVKVPTREEEVSA